MEILLKSYALPYDAMKMDIVSSQLRKIPFYLEIIISIYFVQQVLVLRMVKNYPTGILRHQMMGCPKRLTLSWLQANLKTARKQGWHCWWVILQNCSHYLYVTRCILKNVQILWSHLSSFSLCGPFLYYTKLHFVLQNTCKI